LCGKPLPPGTMHLSRGTSRPRRPARILTLITAAATLVSLGGAASLASAGRTQPADAATAAPEATAADAACPWVGSSAPISQRVSQLLAKMSVAQKVTVLTGSSGSSYVGFTPAIGSLCIPAMNLEDGPAGVGDGMGNLPSRARPPR
jgi:beta-glucosidase